MQNKWAILVGMDHDPASHHEKREEGASTLGECVRDLKQIRSYLQETMAFPESNVYSFIFEMSSTSPSSANADRLPTYSNVVRAFHRVNEQSNTGDVVYIHLSLETVEADIVLAMEYHRGRYEEEAFFLLSDDHRKKYLHSLELAVLVNRLGSKGLDLTVILEKREKSRRKNPRTLAQSDFSQEELASMFHGLDCPRNFDTQLSNPNMEFFFVLITAKYSTFGWKPTPRKHELQNSRPDVCHGFLANRLLKILKSRDAQVTWNDIIRQLEPETLRNRRIDGMLYQTEIESYGNTERLFLQGVENRAKIPPLLSFRARIVAGTDGIMLVMEAGSAHGVNTGVMVRFDPVHGGRGSLPIPAVLNNVMFEVKKVKEFSSSASSFKLSWTEENISRIELGLAESEIYGYAIVVDRRSYGFYPQSEADHIETYVSRLCLLGNSKELLEQIKVETIGGFRYQNGGSEANTRNPIITLDGSLHLLSGDYATIQVSNSHRHVLYFHILYFDSAFGITQVPPKTYPTNPLGSTLAYIETRLPSLTIDFRLLLSIPERVNMEKSGAVTYIKVIATNKPSSFHSLELPAITDKDLVAASHLSSSRILGEYDNHSPQNTFAQKTPESPERDRDMQDEKWACFNIPFVIHSTAESLAAV